MDNHEKADDFSQHIIELSAKQPKFGLMEVDNEINNTIRKIMYNTGWNQSVNNVSIQSSLEFLVINGILPSNILSSIKLFSNIKNKVVHGKEDIADSEIIKVIDIGMALLKTIKSIPQTTHRVYKTNVAIYQDEECKIQRSNVVGLILEEKSPGNSIINYNIYPTTNRDYKVGILLSWEWNINNTYGKSYYVEPDTNNIKLAWDSSAEFIGKDIEILK